MKDLSLRDYIAIEAMKGLLGNLSIQDKEMAIKQREFWINAYGKDIRECDAVALDAYLMADTMIKHSKSNS